MTDPRLRGHDPLTTPRHRHTATAWHTTHTAVTVGPDELAEALRRAWNDRPGYGTDSGEPQVSTSASHSLPPGFGETDWYDTLTRALRTHREAGETIIRACRVLLAAPTPDHGSSLAVCQACDRTVACTPEDRIVAGCCRQCDAWIRREAERRARLTLPPLDRVELVRQRRHHLTAPEEATA